MLEQTGASPLAPRVQLTHSSVHRAQFGGPVWIETSFGTIRGGMGRSAAATRMTAGNDDRQRENKPCNENVIWPHAASH